ncbi:MAG: 2-oxoacid:acceptor oxidoreductase subunit alpha [Ktedonobacterales bacterium]|jgi:2-oxoglutarate ferredoxin oxidoreductase subunit alpha|nr:MAG: 2-oxoacid:acceptor oxidoreductase subunit alpha [Ktedonobacterales bacterium]
MREDGCVAAVLLKSIGASSRPVRPDMARGKVHSLMSTTLKRALLPTEIEDSPAGINNFTIVAATVNGSGSQTANNTLIRALFKMGIPVVGKNIFPSNIQGLPTWFSIRVSKDGFVARRETAEIVVALNRNTAAEDIAGVAPGGVVIYPIEWKLPEDRTDITYYSLPVQQMAKDSGANADMRPYVANMAYVGALVELLGIDVEEIKNALSEHFKGKQGPINLNFGVVQAAIDYVRQNITKRDPFHVQRMNANANKLMINGNSAAALGSCFGGFSVASWYPITPSTSLIDALTDYAKSLRVDPETKRATFAIVQAEDEIAAIGMVVGAGWAGARAMTSTSGPGISLMTEYLGYAYFAEVPAVVWDIQRMGPSTGLPTRVSQGDVIMAYYLGHGDTRQICLLPANMRECFEFGWRSFDLAERLQTPVLVLSDLDLGMNLWMTDPFEYPDQPMDRGKVLSAEDLKRIGSFNRYEDVDGDGIGYRTIPGVEHPNAAYFTRGSGHNKEAQYTERADEWEDNLRRLARKHEYARTLVPQPVVDEMDGAEIGIISYGSNDPGIAEARAMLATRGVKTSYLRIRALPTSVGVNEFVAKYPRLYIVENNFDGQMCRILQSEMPEHAAQMIAITKCDGLPLTGRWIARSIVEQEQ